MLCINENGLSSQHAGYITGLNNKLKGGVRTHSKKRSVFRKALRVGTIKSQKS